MKEIEDLECRNANILRNAKISLWGVYSAMSWIYIIKTAQTALWVRPSTDISALKEISRNLGNHWCSQFFFSIFFARFEHKNFELWEDI